MHNHDNNPLWWSSLQTIVLVLLLAFLVISVTGCTPAHNGCIVVDRKITEDSPVILIHEDQHTLILKNPNPDTKCSSKLLPSSAQHLSAPSSN